MNSDVAVIGLGAMGSMALWRLAQQNVHPLGFERFTPGHAFGSSHGESRIIRTAYFEGTQYVPLLQEAFPLWRELEAQSSTPLLTMTGALMLGAPDGDLIMGTLASAAAYQLDHEVLGWDAMRRRFAQHCLREHEVGVYETQAGFLRPEAAVGAATQQAERLGADLHTATTVEHIAPTATGVRIYTTDGIYDVAHAIIAVGAWLNTFLPDLNLPLQVERQVMMWFPTRDGAAYDPTHCPVYIHETDPQHYRYGFPSLDGTTIKVAVDHEGVITTADTIDRRVNDDDIRKVTHYVREYLADVEPAPTRSTVCMYTNTPDEHFIVGGLPELPHVTLLGGCSGHSFKFAAVMGDIAAELALEGKTARSIAMFSPQRFFTQA